ncbi:MAG: LpqB family beta-propeller domain-containing protein, partial [Candidatus Nanopelagicales bacterium]
YGRAVKLDGTAPIPVSGGAGLASPPLSGIAVSLDAQVIAGLDAEARLWTAPLRSGGASVLAIDEPGLSRPSYGGGEAPWVVNAEGSVLRAEADGTTFTVPIDGLNSKATVESISVSRDGTRAALIVRRGERSFVMVAVIALREGLPRLQAPIRVDNRLNAVNDVAWADADTLAILGADGASSPAIYLVDMGRWQVRSIGATGGIDVLWLE